MLKTFDLSSFVIECLERHQVDVNEALCAYLSTLEDNRLLAAENFIKELLPKDGSILAVNLLAAAEMTGIARATLHRAKVKLDVKSYKTGFGKDAIWYWTR